MADCTLLATCIFFNDKMARMPKTTEFMKNKFCKGDNSICARHTVFLALGREKVPLDLFPGDMETAAIVISAGKK